MAKKTTKKKKPYVISIKLGGVDFRGEGDTIEEALAAIPRPTKVMSKAFLTISHEDKTYEQMYMPSRAKRLFYPQAQYLIAKYLTLGLQK